MDYLDPKKERQYRVMLFVGYALIAVAIALTTRLLLLQAYGFGLGKNGTVIQNGLTYFSSQPNPAQIYVNNKLAPVSTNTRLFLPAGIYHVKLDRTGYREWRRTIELQGGDVQHFDYPFLIPKQLTTKKIQTYPSLPGLVTQSPDHRWLVVEEPKSMTDFRVYDLKNPTKAPTTIALPTNLLTKATASENWQLEEWASDNQHVVLQHNYDGKTEFILVNRTDPAQSVNLDTVLATVPTKLTLNNKKYDRYYLYDTSGGTLKTATLSNTAAVPVLDHVLAYQSYGNSSVLYATDSGAPAGKVLVKLQSGGQTYPIHTFPAGTTYLLNLTQYNGTLYVTASASSENKAYIYADPVGQLQAQPKQALTPAQVLHVNAPNYLSFSDNAQFIVAENTTQFGVYDIQNTQGYSYTTTQPLDAPQIHATWMDGDRLAYVSGGKLQIFDYDNTNQQWLVSASSSYLPAFAPDYKNVFLLTQGATTGQFELTQTSLLTPSDR